MLTVSTPSQAAQTYTFLGLTLIVFGLLVCAFVFAYRRAKDTALVTMKRRTLEAVARAEHDAKRAHRRRSAVNEYGVVDERMQQAMAAASTTPQYDSADEARRPRASPQYDSADGARRKKRSNVDANYIMIPVDPDNIRAIEELSSDEASTTPPPPPNQYDFVTDALVE